MKLVLMVFVLIALSGCGKIDRMIAGFTGDATEVCMGGVLYYQFTSGTAVAYNPNGTVRVCK